MTSAPRLVQDMQQRAAGLRERAAGYRLTGDRRLARLATQAADNIDTALTALVDLAAAENN